MNAMRSTDDTEALERTARQVAGAPTTSDALRRALVNLPSSSGVHIIESVYNRLPIYVDEGLLRELASVYHSAGEPVAGSLTAGMADQIARFRSGRGPGPATPDDAADVAAILNDAHPVERLLEAIVIAETDPARVVALILGTWARLPPILEFWIPYRAIRAFDLVGHHAGTIVLASHALQLSPTEPRATEPAHYLVGNLLGRKRLAAAAAIAIEWGVRMGAVGVLSEASAVAQHVVPLPPAPFADRVELIASDIIPPASPAISGAHPRFRELGGAMVRDPIFLLHYRHVEIIMANNYVGIVHAGGRADNEIWVGLPPTLIAYSMTDAPTLERDRVVVVSDQYPLPNLSHGLTDHAPKLALYRLAGIDIGAATVVGPRPAPFQLEIVTRFGASEWIATDQPCRVRAADLWILSTCARPLHPAHYGAPWALSAIRSAFGVSDDQPVGTRCVYISRADAKHRHLRNETALTRALRPFGFEVIVPGDLSVASQAAIFVDAKVVVAPHGAGLASIVFCRTGTPVLELAHRNYAMLSFVMLAVTRGLKYHMITGPDAGPSETAPIHDDFSNDYLERDFSIEVGSVVEWVIGALRTAEAGSSHDCLVATD